MDRKIKKRESQKIHVAVLIGETTDTEVIMKVIEDEIPETQETHEIAEILKVQETLGTPETAGIPEMIEIPGIPETTEIDEMEDTETNETEANENDPDRDPRRGMTRKVEDNFKTEGVKDGQNSR